jgi:hypothetical protein
LGREFKDLRFAIFPTSPEMQRFRQLVVNTVMATDIMDKDLKTLRNARWERAFSDGSLSSASSAPDAAEHLIQASDVAVSEVVAGLSIVLRVFTIHYTLHALTTVSLLYLYSISTLCI